MNEQARGAVAGEDGENNASIFRTQNKDALSCRADMQKGPTDAYRRMERRPDQFHNTQRGVSSHHIHVHAWPQPKIGSAPKAEERRTIHAPQGISVDLAQEYNSPH